MEESRQSSPSEYDIIRGKERKNRTKSPAFREGTSAVASESHKNSPSKSRAVLGEERKNRTKNMVLRKIPSDAISESHQSSPDDVDWEGGDEESEAHSLESWKRLVSEDVEEVDPS